MYLKRNEIIFKDCFIEGTTDFIFLEAERFYLVPGILVSNSYITAASTPEGTELPCLANRNQPPCLLSRRPWHLCENSLHEL